jgi:Ca2+-binding EF-hand superfamily protein
MPEVFEAQASVSFAPTHIMRILSRRLTEFYTAVKNQLKLEDTEGNGELYRPQLLRVIRATGLQFSEAQLDELLVNIDLLPLKTLNANKFIRIFVPHHPVPSSRVDLGVSIRMPNAPKEMSKAPTMSTPQLKAALQEKLQIALSDPHEMFSQMDQSKDGTLTRHDLYRAFQRYGLFPTEKQVDALFLELDVDRKGRIDYPGFLARLAPKPRSRMDVNAVDDDPYAAARENLRAVTASGQRPPTATAAQMQQALQSKLASRASRERAETFLRAQDIGLLGRVSKEQLLQVLRKFDIFMTAAQFDDLMVSCLKVSSDSAMLLSA